MACAGIWRRMRAAYSSIRSFGIVGLDGNGLAGVVALLNESLGLFDVVLIGVRGSEIGVGGNLVAQIAGIGDDLTLTAAADHKRLFLTYGIGHILAHTNIGEQLALAVHVSRTDARIHRYSAATDASGRGDDIVGSHTELERFKYPGFFGR